MSHAYTEDQLVEQPAIGLFAELGWQTVSVMEETFGATGTLLRETKGEVVLVSRLRAALVRLNPALPPEAISAAVDELTRDRSAMSLEAANREVYLLLKEGIKVSVPDKERGGQKTERLRVVDWEHPANNDFLLVSQFSVTGALYTCRPDLVGFVNGLPLVVIELKKPGVPARVAFDENLTHYKQQIPSLFWFNALLIASNGTDTRDDRLETVAKDIVRHFLGRGFVGKAMVVSIDKATALKMHDKVRAHWAAEIERVQKELGRYDLAAARKAELLDRLKVLQTTDMALIVSPGQNEIEQMKKHGLDIVPHRKRMNESQPPLDEKFKDTEDPLRIVFLCAMWLTGFDAPSCSTVYLDKPMRNHTLMQTIARANRVFPGKHSGMIVDYANVFASLEKALAIYGAGKDGKNPVKDKAKLVADLRRAVDTATTFCATRQVILPAIEQLAIGSLERLQRIDDAVNALISPDQLRREFFGHERLVSTLYGAVKPDPAALEFAGRVASITAIADAIRTKLNPNPTDITEVMGDIGKLLDASITGVDMPAKPAPVMDLSKIDFEALRSRFKESKHKNTDLEVLKAAIRAQLEKLISLNKTRADFAEKFEELIENYNQGSQSIEGLFEELLKLSRNLNLEQERHVRENMTEEELVIFDILTRPAPELSADERAEVKKVARELLNKMKLLLVLNWRQKSTARSQVSKKFIHPRAKDSNTAEGRYEPSRVKTIYKRQVFGPVRFDKISTSYIDRTHLNLRLFNRRLTRLTLGFSKKLEHLKNSVALSIAHYNFCRIHHSLQGETPAMAARLTDHIWSIGELLTESGQIGSEKWICPLLERTVSPPIKNSSKLHNTAMNVPFCKTFHESEFVATIDHDSREHPQPQLA